MKNFNIPGVSDHLVLNEFILELMKTQPECFYPDVKISSVFGNFHFCIWDGGRNFFRYKQATEEEILYTQMVYDRYKVPVRFVFTNALLEEKHLYNRFCNLLLEIFHTGNNEIVAVSPLLIDYIKTNYPNYKIISSTTKRLNTKDKFLEELKNEDYYQVCLDYDLNKQMDLITSIPDELKPKCEFLINAICPAKCPIRRQHYLNNAQTQLTFLKYKYVNWECGIKDGINSHNVVGKGNNFSLKDIDDYYKMGFKYFKLEGRTIPSFDLLCQYLYYFVKPEYYWEILSTVQNTEGIVINSPNADQFYTKINVPMYNAAHG